MLASTGMRRDALVKIELKDLEYLKDYNLYKIRIYKKSDSEQICFTTPEAAEAIKLYVSKRPGAKYFHNVRSKAISMALTKLAIKAGIVQRGIGKEHRNEIPATHGLRKFCITQMAKAKVDAKIAKLLTGHSIGVRGRYLNYSEDDLLREYLKAVDLLTINEANRLRKQVDVLEEKDKEIGSLRQQLKSYESEMSRITDMTRRLGEKVLELQEMSDRSFEAVSKIGTSLGVPTKTFEELETMDEKLFSERNNRGDMETNRTRRLVQSGVPEILKCRNHRGKNTIN